MTSWQPMSTAPRDVFVLLLHCDDLHVGKFCLGEWYVGGLKDYDRLHGEPHAWHPLPEPPTESELKELGK